MLYNKKVIHHNHMLKENNIIDYICNNCNLKIKNTKELKYYFIIQKDMIMLI